MVRSNDAPTSFAPRQLVQGAVRGWHILLLYGLIFVSMIVASAKLTQGMTVDVRNPWRTLVMQGLSAFLVVTITLVVPELRRSLPALYLRRRRRMEAGDVALFVALALAWGLGAHRLLLMFPLLHWDPALFSTLGFSDHLSRPAGLGGLFVLLAIAFIAPAAEELVFRGYLFNLWRARWGLWPGLLMSSVVFGLAHSQFAMFAAVFGALFCLMYLHFGSLWPGTLLHSLYNIVGGPFGLAPYFLEKNRAEVLELSAWIPEIALTVAFFPLLYLFWRRFRPAT